MRLPVVAAYLGWIALSTCQLATAQEPQWWTNQKKACGLSSSLDYNSWAQSGSPCSAGTASPAAPAALTPLQQQELQLGQQLGQQLGYAAGQQLHNWLFGAPTIPQSQPSPDPAQQQRELAAQQLTNSGKYLLKQKNYLGAIHEFQQALAQTPNDADILQNLALAKQQLKDGKVAAETSGALGQLLGKAPANTGLFDFDQLTHSSIANPNASALDLVNLGADGSFEGSVVDLRGTTRTSPESLKNQIDGVLGNNARASAPPDSLVVLPQAQDIELLFQPPQSTPSQSGVVLPQSQDMELLGQPPQSPVVLPQAQDMELLGQPPQSTSYQPAGQQPPANAPKLVNNSDADNTAKSMAELDKILDTKADDDFKRQLDWFNHVYLPAHPELTKDKPASSETQPHN